jgi:hypothetical protein
MIFATSLPEEVIDQGDIIDDCPIVSIVSFDEDRLDSLQGQFTPQRVIVLTQTCDLANLKVSRVLVAAMFEAKSLVDEQVLKAAEIRGPIRASRVYGWYYLPKSAEQGLAESIIDLRQLHTVRLDLLQALCQRGHRRARLQPLYREHLARHFADTYSRIGLPAPYETE